MAECIWSGLTRWGISHIWNVLIGVNNCFEFWHSAVTWSFGGIRWCDLMTFLIWERRCGWGCCDGVGWCFLGISSFDYAQDDFPTAAWSPNILANSCIAPKSVRGHLPICWQRSAAFPVTLVWEQNALPATGLSLALCQGISPLGGIFDLLG